jgi:hypothetical protein
VNPELAVVRKGRRTRFSSDVPVKFLEPCAGRRQKLCVRDRNAVRVSQRGRVVMFGDTEIVLAQSKDLGFDVGHILRVPYELVDNIRL